MSRNQRGFTLLEAVVVIVILGVLAATAIPTFTRVLTRSDERSAQLELSAVGREALSLGAFDGSAEIDDVASAVEDSALTATSPLGAPARSEGKVSGAVDGGAVGLATVVRSSRCVLVRVNEGGVRVSAPGPLGDRCTGAVALGIEAPAEGTIDGETTETALASGTFGSPDATWSTEMYARNDEGGPTSVAVTDDGIALTAVGAEIRSSTSEGTLTTFVGYNGTHQEGTASVEPTHLDGTGTEARFSHPTGLALDPTREYLYVVDDGSHCVRRVTLATRNVETMAGGCSTDGAGHADGVGNAARFSRPRGVTVGDDGTVYVVDTGNACVRKLTPDVPATVTGHAGTCTKTGYSDGATGEALFGEPASATYTSGALVVADRHPSGVIALRIVQDGNVTTRGPGFGSTPGQVSVVGDGSALVADPASHCVYRVSTSGTVNVLTGECSTAGYADGLVADARWTSPVGVTVGYEGAVYVTDTSGVRQIAPSTLR